MKKVKDIIMNLINGLCMALADSVPGVSGGTIAFLLGFYDKFIGSLDDLFRGKIEEKKTALKFLIKIGCGWLIGFLIAATVLSSLFNEHIYTMSSLFLGFILLAIPVFIKEEKNVLKGKYKNLIFTLIGIVVVVGITILNSAGGINIDVNSLNIGTIVYVFIAAMIAITAMILPGISGSTLLLIFGLYIPIMTKIKTLLTFDFSALPILIVFGLGIITGILVFTKLIRKCLEKHRSQTIYTVLGMMIGSMYSIVMGPTTLEVPKEAMTFSTFNIVAFIIGGVIIGGLELLKKYFNSEKVNIKEGDYEFDRTKYYSLNDTQQKAVVENDLVSINKNYDYFDYLIDNGYKDTNDLWKFYAILYDGSIICSPFETVDDAILNGFCYFKFTGNLDDIIYHTQGKSLTKTMN